MTLPRRLTIVRHGHAETQDAGVADFDRALTGRGLAEAAQAGRRLDDDDLHPELILSSPATRTRQTANAIVRELTGAECGIVHDDALYLALPGQLLAAVARTPAKVRHLVLVGHNPGISEFARLLAPDDDLEELVTGASCSLGFASTDWNLPLKSATSSRCNAPRRVPGL